MPSRSLLGAGYTFRHRKQGPSVKGGPLLYTHRYVFRTRLNRTYFVDVEQYKHDIFIIKFYLKNHRGSDKKFNLTTRESDGKGGIMYDNDGWRIISTCLQIMLELRRKYPLLSGGFIGAHLEGEGKCNTKRFKVWSQVVQTFFDPDHYVHYQNLEYSTYFIQCKDSPEPNLVEVAADMFHKLYVDREGIFTTNRPIRIG